MRTSLNVICYQHPDAKASKILSDGLHSSWPVDEMGDTFSGLPPRSHIATVSNDAF